MRMVLERLERSLFPGKAKRLEFTRTRISEQELGEEQTIW